MSNPAENSEAAYWACFFDQGRGTFTPWDKRGGMKIRVESYDKRLLKDLQRSFGGLVSRTRAPFERQWGARTMHCWSISGAPAREMIERVLPYMRRRREIAEAWLKSFPTVAPRGTRPGPTTFYTGTMELRV
jgi:hypothetical protein